MKLQAARQGRKEISHEFADRCRALSQKIVCKVDDPLAQATYYQNAEIMPLATFIAACQVGKLKYANPSTMQEAPSIALSVEKAEKQERFDETFTLNLTAQ
jgi:hypothetical protein